MNTTPEYPLSDPLVANFPSGQKQRVAISRALVSGPALVPADEPRAVLNGKSERDVFSSLQGLAREKDCPIVMVTHDAGVLAAADRITGYAGWMFTLCWKTPRFLCQSTHEMSPR